MQLRVAQSVGIGGLDPSIAKDLIDSEDPKHTLFCRKIAFAAIYELFRDNISIFWSNSNRFATADESLEHICSQWKIFLSTELVGYW